MVQALSRKIASFCLASAITVSWNASAESPSAESNGRVEPPPTLVHHLVDGIGGRVQRLLPSSLSSTIDRLHVKNRALEYRAPLEWEGRELELRVRGGRLKGKHGSRVRGYGLRVELRF